MIHVWRVTAQGPCGMMAIILRTASRGLAGVGDALEADATYKDVEIYKVEYLGQLGADGCGTWHDPL